MKRSLSILWLAAVLVAGAGFANSQTASPVGFDIRSFGAVADGKTKCTEAIRKAISAATAQGGGTIKIPAGVFLTGPIHLESNITLDLDAGAVVKFSTDFDDYLPMVPSRWEGVEVTNFSPLIYAHNASNIAIRGRGKLDGRARRGGVSGARSRRRARTWRPRNGRRNSPGAILAASR